MQLYTQVLMLAREKSNTIAENSFINVCFDQASTNARISS